LAYSTSVGKKGDNAEDPDEAELPCCPEAADVVEERESTKSKSVLIIKTWKRRTYIAAPPIEPNCTMALKLALKLAN